MSGSPSVLLIGYGNPGRLDDGLGPAVAEAAARWGIEGLTVDSDYQLAVEDALALSNAGVVIFADADVRGPEPFHFTRIQPADEVSFTTHSIRPEALVGLARKLFGADTPAYVLGIRGYEFNEFGERLSRKAMKNLDAALAFLNTLISEGDFEEAAGRHGFDATAANHTDEDKR
jgi:hydrogenase maturation protease